MMKKFVSLLFLIFSSVIFACECPNYVRQIDYYSKSELVADVTVIKVYPVFEKTYSQYFKVDLKYNEIFKGKAIKTMFVYGYIYHNGKQYGSHTSCSMGVKVGDRMLIFKNKDERGNWVLHYCDQKIYSKESTFGKGKALLKVIKKENIETNSNFYYLESKELTKLNGIEVKNRFAIFEITVDEGGNILNVKEIKKFGSQRDEEVLKVLKKEKVKNHYKTGFKKGEKFNLILYYYPKTQKNESFISEFFL